jgi:hypothetical protein
VYFLPYIGFVDGVICSTQNLTSASWEIYAPTDELISLHSVFLGRATNNITKYSSFIELLSGVVSHGIRHLIVQLDS